MTNTTLEAHLHEWCASPAWKPGPGTFLVNYGRHSIQQLLGPGFRELRLDSLLRVDLEQHCISGTYRVATSAALSRDGEDREAKGVLLMETMEQLALCLVRFYSAGSPSLSPALQTPAWEPTGRAVCFAACVRAGDVLSAHGRLIECAVGEVYCIAGVFSDRAHYATAVMQLKESA